MIPHKVLNIRCYICTYLALFFIFVFIRLLEYQILQFHAFVFVHPFSGTWRDKNFCYAISNTSYSSGGSIVVFFGKKRQ